MSCRSSSMTINYLNTVKYCTYILVLMVNVINCNDGLQERCKILKKCFYLLPNSELSNKLQNYTTTNTHSPYSVTVVMKFASIV